VPETSDIVELATGLDHPEGVTTGPDGVLYAGGEAGQIYRIDPATGDVEQIASTSGFALGLCLDASGAIYVCDSVHSSIMRIEPSGASVSRFCEIAGGNVLGTPNWPAFARDGSLWFSDSTAGTIVRVPPGGGDGEIADLPPLNFPNGIAFDAAGDLLVLESFTTPRLSRLSSTGLTLVADLPGVVPDGVSVDTEGAAIIGCYYPFRVLRVADGVASSFVDDPIGTVMQMPTNTAFYGEGLTRLAIAALGGWTIASMEMATPGLPLVYP
jgi:gluconolactonase